MSDDDRSQWSAAHGLAVCAVANGHRFGIGFGLERHVTAVTVPIDFHDRFPGTPQIGMDDSDSSTGLMVRSGSIASFRARSHLDRFTPMTDITTSDRFF